jgi:hypothetical protein
MSNSKQARDGLFRELFAEQLKIVAVEAQITSQPLGHVIGFRHLVEVGNQTAALHRELTNHQRRMWDLRSKMKLDEASN